MKKVPFAFSLAGLMDLAACHNQNKSIMLLANTKPERTVLRIKANVVPQQVNDKHEFL